MCAKRKIFFFGYFCWEIVKCHNFNYLSTKGNCYQKSDTDKNNFENTNTEKKVGNITKKLNVFEFIMQSVKQGRNIPK